MAADVDESGVGRAGWLFLQRPEDWEQELDLLVAAEEERAERDRVDADERSAARRAAQMEQAADELRRKADGAAAELSKVQDELDAERTARRAADRAVQQLRARVESLTADRDRAVGELAAARRDSEERLDRLRRAEGEIAALTRERARWAAPVDEAVADARAALGEAAAALDAARSRLRGDDEAGAGGGRGAAERRTGATRDDGGSRRERRVPHRLERGAIDGSVEATDQLLRLPGVDVVVDGYNVSMEAWPHLDAGSQRERLLALLTAATARTGAHVHVVFDGDDDGRRPSVGTPLAVRVHYTPAGVEADDVVIAMANDLPVDRPVVVVSSDRRVRDGARRAGANVVSSSALLAWDRR